MLFRSTTEIYTLSLHDALPIYDLLVIAAGGPAGGFGAVLPPWYGRKSLAVTKGIDR